MIPPHTHEPDAPTLTQSSRSALLSFSHPHTYSALPVLRRLDRIGATVDEQIGPEADDRLGNPGERDDLGMGLGLCKVMAEYFGGHLELFSSYGGGTDAYLTIPRLGTQGSAT